MKDKAKEISVSVAITGIISILFYRSMWAMILLPGVDILVKRYLQQESKQKRIEQLREQFMNGLQVLNTALQAGLSMENAWREVQKETKLLFGETSEFYQEIREINQAVTLNTPIEGLLLDFAYRSEVEELIRFAEILEYGKRSGGNWRKIIDTTVLRMCERHDAQKEIEVLVAEKRLEQRIMTLAPLGILVFLQISAWDYIKILYHNWLGVICMTVFLVIYGLTVLLSNKIMKIQV